MYCILYARYYAEATVKTKLINSTNYNNIHKEHEFILEK